MCVCVCVCYKVKSGDISINEIYMYVELNLIQFGYYVMDIYIILFFTLG